MKRVSLFINICVCIALVNAHGYLYEPPTRLALADPSVTWWGSGGSPGEWYGLNNQLSNAPTYDGRVYIYGGAVHICGDCSNEGSEATRRTKRTYLSGSSPLMTISFGACHFGAFTLKLCVLNSPTDIANQTCFDQNLLRLTPVNPLVTINNVSVVGDDYTILTDHGNGPAFYNFTAQLPPGLTCENCVLLFEWLVPRHCQLRDGSWIWDARLPSNDSHSFRYNPKYKGFNCFNAENRRNCADIKIVKDPNDSAVYQPNPVQPPTVESPKTFECLKGVYSELGLGLPIEIPVPEYITVPHPEPDPLLYIGDGVACYVAGNHSCDDCNKNCMSPDKVCPRYCICRWNKRKPDAYTKREFFWNKNGSLIYAFGCQFHSDYPKPPIVVSNLTREQCRDQCFNTTGCSHFYWVTVFQVSTSCWLKFGPVNQSDAVPYGFAGICGIITSAKIDTSLQFRNGYMGCYFDDTKANTDLSVVHYDFSNKMSIEYCSYLCRNYSFAGMVFGNQCWCGNSLANSFIKKWCTATCTGNKDQICGGQGVKSVYNVTEIMKQGLRNYICQGSLETVSCPNQLSLNITFANWGRASDYICASVYNKYCSSNVTPLLQKLCNGKNKCSISATVANFGKPCKATYNYLDVTYVCQ